MRSKKKEIELLRKDESINSDISIALRDLYFSYNEKDDALKGINLDIKAGQNVSIIGHNGSGKSTLAKLIDGILIQKSGDIYIDQVKMSDDNALLLRKDIALVFQNPDSQFIGATVRDDIAFSLENMCVPSKDMDKIIYECASLVSMEDNLDKEPTNLSGGQKQRVAIAGAIARGCKILILDESGAMLDPKGKREIRETIRKRKNENKDLTIINITHELEDAFYSDRVIVMNEGKIVMDGLPKEIFSRSKELLDMHLDIPFAFKLVNKLREEGIDVPDLNSDEEILEYLCR